MLLEYNSCNTWLEGFRSDKTRKNYMLHLSLFCNFHNTDPDALILLKPDMIKDMILKYIIHLKRTAKTTAGKPIEGEICINTIPTYLTGIQSFLDFHEIPIAWKKMFRFVPESVPSNLRAYQKEEIRKLLSVADLRDRCIILIMASGGLRVGALSDLQIKHQSVLDKNSSGNSDGSCGGSGIGLLKVYPNSKHDSYTALLTPEAMDAIHSYIGWRKDHGERISDDSPLIRDKFDVFTVRKNKPKFLKANTIYRVMARLLDKAGIYSEQLQPDHSFRYFFNSCLMNSDVNHSMKELLMGHSLKLDDFYYDSQTKESRNKILLEYMKALDALSINEEYRLKKKIIEYEDKLKDAPKIGELESHLAAKIIEQDALKKQVELLHLEKQNEIQTMHQKYEQDMNAMREQMSQIMSMIQQNPKLAHIKPEVLTKKGTG